MPLALLVIGLLIVVSGFKNNAGKLGATIATDFKGSGNFFYWVVAVIVIGSLGSNPKLKQVSHLFLLLIVIVFLISNNGFFAQLQSALSNPQPTLSNQLGADDIGSTTSTSPGTTSGMSQVLQGIYSSVEPYLPGWDTLLKLD